MQHNPFFPYAKDLRAKDDFYATDPIAIRLLLQEETFSKDVWECASGLDHLANELKANGYNVRTSDIVKRTDTTEVLDFLSDGVREWDGDIITNPPYCNAFEFVKKALSLVKDGSKVAMFLRIQFLESKARKQFFIENPPKKIYVSSSRIPTAKDGDFDSLSSSVICYCWFVWQKGYKGDTVLKWIN